MQISADGHQPYNKAWIMAKDEKYSQ